ncbi:MAG: hypothetical protein J7497_11720, partial [Chitinophagaceae bacterium]|nr:hypothetical protein [Chitinophagaceae bacterium]
ATHRKGPEVASLAGNLGYVSSPDPYTSQGNQPASVMSRWQKPGDISNYERFSINGLGSPGSDYIYKDCSFIRLKNV